jgi:hypothetical protein
MGSQAKRMRPNLNLRNYRTREHKKVKHRVLTCRALEHLLCWGWGIRGGRRTPDGATADWAEPQTPLRAQDVAVGRAGLVPRCCHSATLLLRLPVLLQLGFGWGKEWRVHDCRLPSMSGVRTVTVSLWLWECSCRMGRWDHGRDMLFWAEFCTVIQFTCIFAFSITIHVYTLYI